MAMANAIIQLDCVCAMKETRDQIVLVILKSMMNNNNVHYKSLTLAISKLLCKENAGAILKPLLISNE